MDIKYSKKIIDHPYLLQRLKYELYLLNSLKKTLAIGTLKLKQEIKVTKVVRAQTECY